MNENKESKYERIKIDDLKKKTLAEVANKEIAVEVSPRDIIREYLSNEDNRERLTELALQFHTISRGKWFTINDIKKKVLEDMREHVSMYMDLLTMSKKAFAKKRGDGIVYKITLNQDIRKKLLENNIKELEQTLENCKKELLSLQ